MPAFTGRNIDPGTLPSIPVAVKVKGGAEFQGVIPLRGDQATNEYDSGMVTLPNTLTELTASRVYIDTIRLTNLTDQVQKVTVQNTAGKKILSDYPLHARDVKTFPLGAAESLGISWQGENASAVDAQITGWL